MKKHIILIMLFLSLGLHSYSQDTEALKQRAAEMVGQLGDYLQYMADKNKSLKTRQYYRNKALNLFIGKGDEYTIGGKVHPAVRMETTTANKLGSKPASKPMSQYFTNLINLNYANVKIETTEIAKIKVSDLKKIADDMYMCTCYIDQVFVGYGADGRPKYKDKTRKSVQCYITVEQTVDNPVYIIQLGNVTATHTERL